MRRRRQIPVALLMVSVLAGCSGSSGDLLTDDSGLLRAVHGMPEVGPLTMTFGTRVLTTFDFQQISGLTAPGNDEARVAFDFTFPGDEQPTRLLGRRLTTAVDLVQTMVLTGTFDDPGLIIWEEPGRNWPREQEDAGDEELTVLEVSFGHAALGFGAVDVYLGEPGFDPMAATPLGTLNEKALLPTTEVDSADYELVLTAPGDPTTVRFASATLNFPAATSILFVLIDSGGVGTGEISLQAMGPGFRTAVVDANLPATLRTLHSAPGAGDVDVFAGEDLNTPLIPGLQFGSISDYVEAPIGDEVAITITPAGDTSVLLVEETIVLNAGSEHTMFLLGASGAEEVVRTTDNNRRILGVAKFRLVQGTPTFGEGIDVYLVEPGTSIDAEFPVFTDLPFKTSTGYLSIRPASWDLIVTENGSKTPLAGPVPVELESKGIYGITAVDAAEMTAIDLILFDDFEPGLIEATSVF